MLHVLKDGCAFRQLGMLFKKAGPNVWLPFNVSVIGQKAACQNPQQCRFSGSVCTDKAGVFAFQQAEPGVLKDNTVSIYMGQIRDMNNTHGDSLLQAYFFEKTSHQREQREASLSCPAKKNG